MSNRKTFAQTLEAYQISLERISCELDDCEYPVGSDEWNRINSRYRKVLYMRNGAVELALKLGIINEDEHYYGLTALIEKINGEE